MTTSQLPARFRLLDGYDFPRIINGCWQLADGHAQRPIDRERTLRQLENLVRAGLNTFDCADIYTGVEDLLGELRRRVEPEGLEIHVHTKCVPDLDMLPRISKRYIERIIDRSLGRLGTERLDLVQFHWWDFEIPGWIDTALWLDDLRREGKIARLGLTNTDVPHLAEILEAGVPIVVNQVQYSLLDRRPEHGLAAFCIDQGVQLICYGTLGGGLLTERYLGAPDPEPPLANRSLVKYRLILEELGGWGALQTILRVLAEIATKHRASVSNVASRWVLDRPAVGAVAVGTVDDRHLESNLELFHLSLDVEDRARIAGVLDACSEPPGDVYALERDWDGPHGRLLRTDLNSGSD
jgi:aryl-alcohol dehydrogenase-like predicted oxidoreductase